MMVKTVWAKSVGFRPMQYILGGKLNNHSWSKWPEHKMKVNLCLKTQICIFVLECRIESQIDY